MKEQRLANDGTLVCGNLVYSIVAKLAVLPASSMRLIRLGADKQTNQLKLICITAVFINFGTTQAAVIKEPANSTDGVDWYRLAILRRLSPTCL